jgi:hypothetical protein
MADKAHKQDVAQAGSTRSAREQSGRTQARDNALEDDPSSHAEPGESATTPGQLAVDDRGNVSWEWADDPELQADDLLGKTARLHALAPGHLSIENEEFDFAVGRDPIPVRKKPPGYNPYDNGEPTRQSWKKKRDLREFSKWVALRKRIKNESGGKP